MTALSSFSNTNAFTRLDILGSIFLVLISLVCALLLAMFCAEKFEGDRKRNALIFTGITLLITVALICFFGFSQMAIKGILFCLILLFCSCSDLKTRECPDVPYLLLAVAAFIGTELTALPDMLLGAFAVFVLQFCGAWATKAVLNGADLKLSTACAFLLGTTRGFLGLFLGMLLGIIVNLCKGKDRKEGFPLIPYLAVGFMAAYFI